MSKKPSKQILPEKKPADSKKVIYGFLIVLSISFMVICQNHKFIQDDAYISFRYVQNFVDGNGLVFNIGEKVEGYTNLLWVLILSVFVFLKMNIETISRILSMLFGIVVLFATYSISSVMKFTEDKSQKKAKVDSDENRISYLSLIPPVMLACTGSFIFWASSGMETSMFMALILLGIYYYIKERKSEGVNYRFPLFILLATLTRPEGLYFFGLILIHKFVIEVKENKSAGIRKFFSKNNLVTYLVYVVPVIFYFLIRYMYYGYLFPNTYYAKTGSSGAYLNAGIEYFTKFMTTYMFYGLMIVVPLFLFKRKENFFEVLLFYIIIIPYLIYIITVGGDVLKQNRFFLPILPLIYILFEKTLLVIYFSLRKKVSQGMAYATVLIIAAFVCGYYYFSHKENLESDIRTENGLVDKMKISGAWFKTKQQQLGRPMNLAATTIGAVSYFAGPQVNVIDLLGLTDKEIAHNPKIIPEISEGEYGWKERKYNADYVMSRDPDYIYFSTGVKPSAYAERALYTNAEFMQYYFPYYISDKPTNFTDVVYKRMSDDEVKHVKWDFPGNPNYKVTYVNMFNQAMNSSRDKSRTQAALGEFKQSIETGPAGFGLPYQYMGDIYLQMGKKDLAIENYKKAVDINDHYVLANYQLYQLYSEKGDTANARMSLDNVRRYDPEILR